MEDRGRLYLSLGERRRRQQADQQQQLAAIATWIMICCAATANASPNGRHHVTRVYFDFYGHFQNIQEFSNSRYSGS